MRLLACAAALVLGVACLSCGSPPAQPSRAAVANEPRWQDLFDTLPELFVVARPPLLRQDKAYGPLVRTALAAAREHSRVVTSAHLLEAIEDAEQVVVGVRPETADRPGGELIVVVQGVRADLDPAKLVDDDGTTPWQPGPPGRVRELTCDADAHGHSVSASLFELPGRTWVIATGDARVRARQAFAHPFARPDFDLDPSALVIVRLDGPSLVAHVRPLQDLGSLAAVGHRLTSVTMSLPPGGEGTVTASFAYAGEDAAAVAEVTLHQVIDAVKASHRPAVSWLASATVERPDKRIVLTAPLPPALVGGLLQGRGVPVEGTLNPAAN